MNSMPNIAIATKDNVQYPRNPHEYNIMSDGMINAYLMDLMICGVKVMMVPTDNDNSKESKA